MNYFWISIIFQVKTPNISWFQLFSCEDLLPFSAFYDCKFIIVGFWTSGETKQDIWRLYLVS